MIRSILTALMLLVGCSSCHPQPTPAPVPTPAPAPQPAPAPLGDAGPNDACNRACVHLRELGCVDGLPTPQGASCEQACRHDSAEPIAMLTPTYLGCIATMARCADEMTCAR